MVPAEGRARGCGARAAVSAAGRARGAGAGRAGLRAEGAAAAGAPPARVLSSPAAAGTAFSLPSAPERGGTAFLRAARLPLDLGTVSPVPRGSWC